MATGSQLGGAISGAATGWAIGGPVGGVIGGVLGLFSGDNGNNAKVNRQYAEYNARVTREAGMYNASAIMAMAGANAQMSMAAARFNVGIQGQVDQYNAQLKSFLGNYNAGLLEAEVAEVWESMDLDLLQMGQQFSRELGQQKVAYGASGVMMNQDSPLVAEIDANTQHELDVMIVRHGADKQAKKLLDAAARSRWEGNMEAASIMFEGRMNSAMTMGNAALASAGALVQGNIDSQMTMYNSNVNANQILARGESDYQTYKSQDRQALTSGLFGAATVLGKSYFDNKTIDLPDYSGMGSKTYSGSSRSNPSYLSSGWAPYVPQSQAAFHQPLI